MTTLDYRSYTSSSLVVPGEETGPSLEIAMWYTSEPGLMALDSRRFLCPKCDI